MAIHFSQENWAQVKANYAAWWAGTLDRHLMRITVTDAYPATHTPRAPILTQANAHDFRYSPEELIEALDVQMGQYAFYGDAFPFVSFDRFGPGVLSAFCGARLDNSSGTIWFFPDAERELDQIHVVYNPENQWVRRIKDIYRAGIRKWGNMVVLGMPDLGGVLDVAATFRGTENLLLDLYDDPDEVLRLCAEIEVAWYEAYADFSSILRDAGIGFSYWSSIYSDEPSYILQCDFAYMISPEMFRKFVMPTLRRDCKKITNTIYHLDGIGQLAHLDDLLTIDELNAVQWIYGDGQLSGRHWMDVYKKIDRAGKRFQMIGDMEDFEAIAPNFQRGIYFNADLTTEQMRAAHIFCPK